MQFFNFGLISLYFFDFSFSIWSNETMKGTSIVGYIALLMILGASLGRGNHADIVLRADAMSASDIFSELADPGYATPGTYSTQNSTVRCDTPVTKKSESLYGTDEKISPLILETTNTVSEKETPAKNSRYIRVIIDGIPYEGTLHANSINAIVE